MRVAAQHAWLELLLLATSAGCHHPAGAPRRTSLAASSNAAPALARLAAPRLTGRFIATGCGQFLQSAPRLPDAGEWRCAELAQVVWCAGGKPAAGVVSAAVDTHFACGTRWSDAGSERICIDRHPEYPGDRSDAYACRFKQEHGIARLCRAATESVTPESPPAGAIAACWIDRDCPSGACDRGVCRCRASSDCQAGRCEAGFCAEAKP